MLVRKRVISLTRRTAARPPGRQSYQYNPYNQVTQQTNRLWNDNETVTSVYSNNRKQNWGYDADGGVTFDDNTGYTRDAAGRIVQAANDVSIALNKFDGDGRLLGTTSTHPSFFSTVTITTYYLNSTVLGGLAVAELNASGQKTKRYVYAGGRKLAEAFSDDTVYWAHQDPVTGSRGDSAMGNFYFAKAEFNADGIDVGFEAPQATGFEEAQPALWAAAGTGSNCGFNNPNCVTCYLDGFEHDCGSINWEAVQQCPNNDCGPRVVPDRNGNPVLRPLTTNPHNGQLGYWPNGYNAPGVVHDPMGNPMRLSSDPSGVSFGGGTPIYGAFRVDVGDQIGEWEYYVTGYTMPLSLANWPRFPTIENFTRGNEGMILDALAVIFSKQCSQAYEHEKLRSPATISNTRGAVIRPAEDLRNRSATDLGLDPATYRDAQKKVNTGQAGTVFGADGRLQIYLNNYAFVGESIGSGNFSLDEVLAHEFIHEGLSEWPDPFWPPPLGHHLAGFPGYKRIIEACK